MKKQIQKQIQLKKNLKGTELVEIESSLIEQKNFVSQIFEEKVIELLKAITITRLKNELKGLSIFLGFLGLAVGGRVALQYVPSVEPIIPLAVLVGLRFGVKEGFTLGGSAYIISNFFVWGMQGPWTVFQALGAGIPGALAGLIGKIKKPGKFDLIFLTIIGTILFEVSVNIGGYFFGLGTYGGPLGLLMYFITSIPFSLTHITSNIVFAAVLQFLLNSGGKQNEDKKVIDVFNKSFNFNNFSGLHSIFKNKK